VTYVDLFYLLQLIYIFSEYPHPPFMVLNKLLSFSCYWPVTKLTAIFNENKPNIFIWSKFLFTNWCTRELL